MPTELRQQSPPRSFDPSSPTAKRPALALVRRPTGATEQARESEQPHSALLAFRLATGNAQAATVALSSALDDSASAMALRGWLVQSLLLEAIMRDAFGDGAAAEQSLEHALDLARPDRVLRPFLVHPVPALLERHAGRLTAHADLIAEIFNLPPADNPAGPVSGATSLPDPLTESELRVLRYLPTDLSTREIADELYLSVHTIKTHVKHLYAKLDAHSRREAVKRARALGLLSHTFRNR
jgi:LuxR family transcriptional regulator, maltose regulon positive regulatory protein